MAVTHAFGFARDLNLNCPTETSTLVHHQSPRLALTTGSQPLSGSPGNKPNLAFPSCPNWRELLRGCARRPQKLHPPHSLTLQPPQWLYRSPIATKNHCSIGRPSAPTYLVNNRTTRPSVFCCIGSIWHAVVLASSCLLQRRFHVFGFPKDRH